MFWRDILVTIASILGGILAIIIYTIPTYIAFKHRHPSKIAILLLNVLLGWTILGYIISLVWAFLPPVNKKFLRKQI